MLIVDAIIWCTRLPVVSHVLDWATDRVLGLAEDFDPSSTTDPQEPVE